MLKFFFDRASWIVRLLNFSCAGMIFYLLFRSFPVWPGLHWGFLDSYFAFSWLFFNLLHWINWYPGVKGQVGIRLHFQKNVVPIVYGTVFVFGLRMLGVSWAWLWPLGLLWLPVYYVSFILLFFHFKDKSDLMPSYFSHNFYREDETS